MTIKDVAELAGVSMTTVSRTLNGSAIPCRDTRQKVMEAARQLGYFPNQSARMLRRKDLAGNKKTNGVIAYISNVTEIDRNGMHVKAQAWKLHLLGSALNERGMCMLTRWIRPEDDNLVIPQVLDEVVDGVITSIWQSNAVEMLRKIVPVVMLNADVRKDVTMRIPSVNYDQRAATDKIVAHLYALGHRRVALFRPSLDRGWDPERWAAFVSSAGGVGMEIPSVFEKCWGIFPHNHERVMDEFAALLLPMIKKRAITALMSGNDVYSWAVIERLQKSGVRIPEDLSVTGFGSPDPPVRGDLRLTAAYFPWDALVPPAVEKIIQLVKSGDTGVDRLLIRPDIIVGNTTGPAAG